MFSNMIAPAVAAVVRFILIVHNRTAHYKVNEHYQDVQRIERSVAEIHRMFLDLALLTNLQGKQIDTIEYDIRQAADDITDGNEDLVDSIQTQKKIRKKQCYLSGIAATCVGVLLLLAL